LMMLSTMGPNIVFIRLSVVLTCWIVAELLGSWPLFVNEATCPNQIHQ
jgi:hypothetical protein